MRYALTMEVPGIFGLYPPVVETGESGLKGAKGQIVRNEKGDLRVWWNTGVPTMVTSLTHGTAVDLDHPLGRAAAWSWMFSFASGREMLLPPWRFDLGALSFVLQSVESHWAADVFGYSVLSMTRGGKPLQGLMGRWGDSINGPDCRQGRFGMCTVGHVGHRWWALHSENGILYQGLETGWQGRQALDAEALHLGLGLEAEHGLVLPPLPETSR